MSGVHAACHRGPRSYTLQPTSAHPEDRASVPWTYTYKTMPAMSWLLGPPGGPSMVTVLPSPGQSKDSEGRRGRGRWGGGGAVGGNGEVGGGLAVACLTACGVYVCVCVCVCGGGGKQLRWRPRAAPAVRSFRWGLRAAGPGRPDSDAVG